MQMSASLDGIICDAHPDRCSQPELAREMIESIFKRVPARTVHLLFDGAYATSPPAAIAFTSFGPVFLLAQSET
jgi:hypothetical protein